MVDVARELCDMDLLVHLIYRSFRDDWLILIICLANYIYRRTSNISRTLVGNKIVDHSNVVGASLVGAAPATTSFSM